MKADPLFSAGARFERKAVREYLERRMANASDPDVRAVLTTILAYVKTRQARYDKRPGGLGAHRLARHKR